MLKCPFLLLVVGGPTFEDEFAPVFLVHPCVPAVVVLGCPGDTRNQSVQPLVIHMRDQPVIPDICNTEGPCTATMSQQVLLVHISGPHGIFQYRQEHMPELGDCSAKEEIPKSLEAQHLERKGDQGAMAKARRKPGQSRIAVSR